MNRLIKIVSKITLSFIILFSLAACHEPILYYIKQEVKLEKATILGDIFTIVRFTDSSNNEKLFIANGNIYSKDASNDTYGSWSKMPAPPGHVHSLASDGTCLYAFVTDYDPDTGSGETGINSKKIYYSADAGNSWALNNISNSISQDSTIQQVILMCTNAPKKEHRYAYIRIGNSNIYLLTGATYNSTAISGTQNVKSCAYKSEVKFFDTYGACSDETYTSEANGIYFSKYAELLYTTTGNTSDARSICNYTRSEILGIAAMSDSVLIATKSGMALINKNTGSEIEFSNLTSTMSTLYENHDVIAVYPERTAFNNIIYASNQVIGNSSNSAQFSHQGLWSYYPNRGKWNIE